MGSLTGFGGVKIPGALMGAIVESAGGKVARTPYEVAGWGQGELWTSGGLVVAHEFSFGESEGSPRGTAENGADHLVRLVRAFLAGEAVPLEGVPMDFDWCTPFQLDVIARLR